MHPRQLWRGIVDWHVPIIKFNNAQVTQFLYSWVQTFGSYMTPVPLTGYTDKHIPFERETLVHLPIQEFYSPFGSYLSVSAALHLWVAHHLGTGEDLMDSTISCLVCAAVLSYPILHCQRKQDGLVKAPGHPTWMARTPKHGFYCVQKADSHTE